MEPKKVYKQVQFITNYDNDDDDDDFTDRNVQTDNGAWSRAYGE